MFLHIIDSALARAMQHTHYGIPQASSMSSHKHLTNQVAERTRLWVESRDRFYTTPDHYQNYKKKRCNSYHQILKTIAKRDPYQNHRDHNQHHRRHCWRIVAIANEYVYILFTCLCKFSGGLSHLAVFRLQRWDHYQSFHCHCMVNFLGSWSVIVGPFTDASGAKYRCRCIQHMRDRRLVQRILKKRHATTGLSYFVMKFGVALFISTFVSTFVMKFGDLTEFRIAALLG